MEDVLDLYAAPPDPQQPVVCFDEKPVQLLADTRPPMPARPGQVARHDYEYERCGTANLFIVFQPAVGWRAVTVTARRTQHEFAEQMKELVDTHFPQATRIRVVLDNLNTHTVAALYARFPAAEARRLARKLEFHYTPVHGSWLNMVEIELSVLSRQCLSQRISTAERLQQVVTAWAAARNETHETVQWRFTTSDARTKLGSRYPSPAAPAAQMTIDQ
jgi:DDE superfamily endonuclease